MDTHEDEIDMGIKCLINNLYMYKEAKSMYNQMEPVTKALITLTVMPILQMLVKFI